MTYAVADQPNKGTGPDRRESVPTTRAFPANQGTAAAVTEPMEGQGWRGRGGDGTGQWEARDRFVFRAVKGERESEDPAAQRSLSCLWRAPDWK
ncbi:hypothetical protein chiPu_0026053 [Chiloscyllium punctatum]|uniref:Uncharacterized protein n=1 Tax=Chiloscyllium punctatum TaxID=137246 RepID=A0A401THC5_CHIPU|nr:hypothetical protein [Chiloscyllium punctatum]